MTERALNIPSQNTDYELGVLRGFWMEARKLAFIGAADEAGSFRTLVELVAITERTLDREA